MIVNKGEWFYSVYENRFYTIDKVDYDKQRFTYTYEDDYDRFKESFWLSFSDPDLLKLMDQKEILHIKDEKERLVIQLKYSSAI